MNNGPQKKTIDEQKVKKPKKEINSTKKPSEEEQDFHFSFSYNNWLKSVKTNNFNNYQKDEEAMLKSIAEIFHTLIPKVIEEWESKIKYGNADSSFPHCHAVDPSKVPVVEKAIEEIHGKKLLDEENEFNYWQLGIRGSERIIAIFDHKKKKMYPVLVDYHHLLHPDINYNEKDFNMYSFCLISDFAN